MPAPSFVSRFVSTRSKSHVFSIIARNFALWSLRADVWFSPGATSGPWVYADAESIARRPEPNTLAHMGRGLHVTIDTH